MVFILEPTNVPEGILVVVVDDDGEGGSVLDECDEINNEIQIETGLC